MSGKTVILVVLCGIPCGCAAAPRSAPPATATVDGAWRQREQRPAGVTTTYRERQDPSIPNSTPGATVRAETIATVNGHRVDRGTLVNLLVRSRGAELLEQLVAFEAVKAMGAERGLTVSASDVAFERRKAAERIWNPLAPFTTAPLDDASAEKLLTDVLAQKNISGAEFDIVLRRNAMLRKIVASEQTFSEADYEAEFQRTYGVQTRVRHIQLATPGEVSRVQGRLDSGEPFETLASNFSANQASALAGGLLEPFSRSEDQLPELFRQTAFALDPGMVSGAVRVGSWYHLIRVEERIPAQTRVLAMVREEMTQRLRRRLSEGAMFLLYEKVLREATIEIFDPVLREAYLARAKKRDS